MREINMEKTYSPSTMEDRIYQDWLSARAFEATVNSDKKPYTIMMPPPNITGQLHMGHALVSTLQDILIRTKRMQGYEALWLPGTDHASIATEAKIVEAMREEGVSKEDLGREGFLDRAWAWRDTYGRKIVEQLKKMGCSCDFSRERFTLDESLNRAVNRVFVSLYEKGYIYKGEKIINWCPNCDTTISDAEVDHDEKAGNLWHIRYTLEEGGYLEVATTRPETMLGDTALAVNPKDPRYKGHIGKYAILPLLNRRIPVIADDYVEMEFGTGVVKITPGHDPNDFLVGERHNLPIIIVMNDDATMNERAGAYCGLDRYDARKKIVEDLKALDLLSSIKEHKLNIGECSRCSTVVEPMVKLQWFVKMEELARPAIDAVRNDDTRFVPKRFEKIYFNWLENIKDWCISRQLWWGHRIPAYYCRSCGHMMISEKSIDKCEKCSGELLQDEGTLDTWFSSALWPFSTLGWPEETEDLKFFYPTDVLVTGYDIIFFWVVRMVFSSLEFMGEVPFKDVYINGLVRDSLGRKMSKSLGNGIDPLDVIEKYGADALRFMLVNGNSPGNDLRYHDEKVEAARNFANKLWNASRFVFMHGDVEGKIDINKCGVLDKWILSKLQTLIGEVTDNIDKYELGIAAGKIYDFTWNELCDWYIELSKPVLYGDDLAQKSNTNGVLSYVLASVLKLLHPFMPFITEEIWPHISKTEVDNDLIIRSSYPKVKDELINIEAEKDGELLKEIIRSIRNIRAEANVQPSKKIKAFVLPQTDKARELLRSNELILISLAGLAELSIWDGEKDPEGEFMSGIVDGAKILLPLMDLIDLSKEIERLEKEYSKVSNEIKRVQGMLSNQGFVDKAPPKLIEAERDKKLKFEEILATLGDRISNLKGKI